jgi:hypothetical protein
MEKSMNTDIGTVVYDGENIRCSKLYVVEEVQ